MEEAKGQIYQINVKHETEGERGIPKFPIKSALFSLDGVMGDFNRYRTENNGRDPDSALLLIPYETIQQLNEEGWPINIGDLGENITTFGLDYDSFQVGNRYLLGFGKELEIQISRACTACKNLASLPYVGDKIAEFVRTLTWKEGDDVKNRRGWYARVLKEGQIETGGLIERIIK